MKDLCYIYEDINIFLVNKLEKRKKSLKKKSSSRTKKSSNNRNKKLKSKKIRFEDLEKSILEGDIDEQIEVVRLSYDEIISKIKNAEIIDLKTISAFNVFDNYFKNDLPEFNK